MEEKSPRVVTIFSGIMETMLRLAPGRGDWIATPPTLDA
jgi:hypothetical protein